MINYSSLFLQISPQEEVRTLYLPSFMAGVWYITWSLGNVSYINGMKPTEIPSLRLLLLPALKTWNVSRKNLKQALSDLMSVNERDGPRFLSRNSRIRFTAIPCARHTRCWDPSVTEQIEMEKEHLIRIYPGGEEEANVTIIRDDPLNQILTCNS